jgi:hypothetical protein
LISSKVILSAQAAQIIQVIEFLSDGSGFAVRVIGRRPFFIYFFDFKKLIILFESLTSNLTSASTNFPADRLYTKFQNIGNALNSDYETWQRIFSLLGYSKYNLGIEDGKGGVDTRSKIKVPELKAPELKIPVLK